MPEVKSLLSRTTINTLAIVRAFADNNRVAHRRCTVGIDHDLGCDGVVRPAEQKLGQQLVLRLREACQGDRVHRGVGRTSRQPRRSASRSSRPRHSGESWRWHLAARGGQKSSNTSRTRRSVGLVIFHKLGGSPPRPRSHRNKFIDDLMFASLSPRRQSFKRPEAGSKPSMCTSSVVTRSSSIIGSRYRKCWSASGCRLKARSRFGDATAILGQPDPFMLVG